MIQVILGSKGSGKTKRLIDLTNEALKQEHGNIIFIDDDNRYMYDLRHEIRFVNASEYPAVYKCSANRFLGFLCGMLSADYDLSLVTVDAFKKIVKTDLDCEEMRDFFAQLETLSENHHCDIVISINTEGDVPEFISKYAL